MVLTASVSTPVGRSVYTILSASSHSVSHRITEYAVVSVAVLTMFTWYHDVPRCTTPVAVAIAVQLQEARDPQCATNEAQKWVLVALFRGDHVIPPKVPLRARQLGLWPVDGRSVRFPS